MREAGIGFHITQIKKSLPALIYALEVCALNKSDLRALDYVVDLAVKKNI